MRIEVALLHQKLQPLLMQIRISLLLISLSELCLKPFLFLFDLDQLFLSFAPKYYNIFEGFTGAEEGVPLGALCTTVSLEHLIQGLLSNPSEKLSFVSSCILH